MALISAFNIPNFSHFLVCFLLTVSKFAEGKKEKSTRQRPLTHAAATASLDRWSNFRKASALFAFLNQHLFFVLLQMASYCT